MIRRTLLAAAILVAAPVLNPAMAQDPESSKAFKEANDKMMKDMMMSPMGDADQAFTMMMIPHHQGAIDMAEIEIKYGKDPILKKMAQKIIAAQKKEIEEFKKWQSKNKM